MAFSIKTALDDWWCVLPKLRTWSIELIGLVENNGGGKGGNSCWGMLITEREPKKGQKLFRDFLKRGGCGTTNVTAIVPTFVLSKTNDAINFPTVGAISFLLISKSFQHRFASNLKWEKGFIFLYLAPGKYMDPSMKTEPHSRTYQQEHNSPRL